MIPYQAPRRHVENMVKLRPMKNWYVYVAKNPKGILYTGIAKNVAARIEAHSNGSGAKFTRGRGPWTTVHTEGPMGHGEALKREIQIKKDRVLKKSLKEKA